MASRKWRGTLPRVSSLCLPGTVAATEVTVPTPGEAGVVQERVVPFEVSTCPLVPTVVRPGALATMISGECSEVT